MTDFARLVLDADTKGLKRGERELQNVSKQANKTAGSVDKSAGAMAATFTRLGGVLAATFSVSQFVRLADTFASMNAQLRLVTNSTSELAEAERRLFEMSQANRVGYESTVQLFARIARSTETLGVSQEQALRVTDTINKALVISGTSATQAAGSLMQLGQAFASGALRGDELNSVLEGMPRVAQAIAEGMGVTVGELRRLGAEGELTGEQVFNALLKMSDGIDEEFGRMPVTVGQSLTMVGNSVLKLVGEFDSASNSSASLAESIAGLANTLDGAGAFVRAFGVEVNKAFQGLSFLAGKVRQVADTFLSYYIPAVERARAAMRWLGIPIREGGGSGGNSTLDVVNALKRAAADTGPAFDGMAASSVRVGRALSSGVGGGARQATAAIKETRDELADLMERLYPENITRRQMSELEMVSKAAGRTAEQIAQDRRRVLGIDDPAEVSRDLITQGPLNAVKRVMDIDIPKSLEELQGKAKRTTVTIADTFAQMSQRITSSLSGLANSIRSGDFLGILSGVLDIFTQLGSAGVFGKGLANTLNKSSLPSADGGGFTGMGARSGGLDGKGGFLAMLHPRETVIDHTRGQMGAPMNITVTPSPYFDVRVDGRIVQAAPAVANAGAMQAQAMGARSARRRVR